MKIFIRQNYQIIEPGFGWEKHLQIGQETRVNYVYGPKKAHGPVQHCVDPKWPKRLLSFFFFWNRNGQMGRSWGRNNSELLNQLVATECAQCRFMHNEPKYGKTDTHTHSYRYRYIARVSRICEISLIKSTNVQIMQDVLKYGKHLNISWAEFQASYPSPLQLPLPPPTPSLSLPPSK